MICREGNFGRGFDRDRIDQDAGDFSIAGRERCLRPVNLPCPENELILTHIRRRLRQEEFGTSAEVACCLCGIVEEVRRTRPDLLVSRAGS